MSPPGDPKDPLDPPEPPAHVDDDGEATVVDPELAASIAALADPPEPPPLAGPAAGQAASSDGASSESADDGDSDEAPAYPAVETRWVRTGPPGAAASEPAQEPTPDPPAAPPPSEPSKGGLFKGCLAVVIVIVLLGASVSVITALIAVLGLAIGGGGLLYVLGSSSETVPPSQRVLPWDEIAEVFGEADAEPDAAVETDPAMAEIEPDAAEAEATAQAEPEHEPEDDSDDIGGTPEPEPAAPTTPAPAPTASTTAPATRTSSPAPTTRTSSPAPATRSRTEPAPAPAEPKPADPPPTRSRTTPDSGDTPLIPPVGKAAVQVQGPGKVELVKGRQRLPVPGVVPSGRYSIEVQFPDEPAPVAVGNVTVSSGQTITLVCNARMGRCRPQ